MGYKLINHAGCWLNTRVGRTEKIYKGGSKGFFAARARAIYAKMHASAE